VEYNCLLIKVDWLDAYIALRVTGVHWLFSSGVGVKFAQSSANGKRRPKPKEISQTMLSNKKQGNLG
jgi:hypothetical protein